MCGMEDSAGRGPDDPATALAAVIALRRVADRMEREAVDLAVERGWTWQQVAQALGISRQAAHKRHASRLRHQRRHPEEHS
jgi:DNA-directed RNA polymerase specialized sigma24 family protein